MWLSVEAANVRVDDVVCGVVVDVVHCGCVVCSTCVPRLIVCGAKFFVSAGVHCAVGNASVVANLNPVLVLNMLLFSRGDAIVCCGSWLDREWSQILRVAAVQTVVLASSLREMKALSQ